MLAWQTILVKGRVKILLDVYTVDEMQLSVLMAMAEQS